MKIFIVAISSFDPNWPKLIGGFKSKKEREEWVEKAQTEYGRITNSDVRFDGQKLPYKFLEVNVNE